ncbi:MAG TPA: hypothetical protein VKX39_04215 [Bryobacteraceae bacterium]|jgi:hypothetical protein|nr:hypothetical protein [Bryobacteraceae bacterium]
MTEISFSNGDLVLEVEGWDKLWALRSRLTIPRAHVLRVYADPQIAERWYKGIRLGGTHIPGVIAAGTFYRDGEWVFWDVHHPGNTIVIELRDEHYKKLVVEVANPAETVERANENSASHRPCLARADPKNQPTCTKP